MFFFLLFFRFSFSFSGCGPSPFLPFFFLTKRKFFLFFPQFFYSIPLPNFGGQENIFFPPTNLGRRSCPIRCCCCCRCCCFHLLLIEFDWVSPRLIGWHWFFFAFFAFFSAIFAFDRVVPSFSTHFFLILFLHFFFNSNRNDRVFGRPLFREFHTLFIG